MRIKHLLGMAAVLGTAVVAAPSSAQAVENCGVDETNYSNTSIRSEVCITPDGSGCLVVADDAYAEVHTGSTTGGVPYVNWNTSGYSWPIGFRCR